MTTYPFVKAPYFTRGGLVSARAILWHMAEGYGTVSYLTHPRLNVSAHFVVERTGRIVQMVDYDDAAHSAHVAIDPDDADATDCGGLYDPRIGKQLLGAGWADINAYVVAVEVEGFRSEGPNALQADAIAALGSDLFQRYETIRGNLGHRDVQDYKGCPGCKFPWDRIGGHGLTTGTPQGADDMAIQLPTRCRSDYKLDLPADAPFWLASDLSGKPTGRLKTAQTVDYFGATVGEPSRAVRLITGTPYSDGVMRPTLCYVRRDVGEPYYVAPSTEPPAPADAVKLDPGLYLVD